MASDAFLVVAEDFYSIQGEGVSAGTPAVFLRLAGCNMNCLGFSYQDPESGNHLGCDTALVWKTGQKETPLEVIQRWRDNGYVDKLEQGAHLIMTGGEPLLQQLALRSFIELIDEAVAAPVFIEIETNATVLFAKDMLARINQINASPKLKHSGEPEKKRYQPEVLRQLSQSNKVFFKFVIASPSDVDEVESQYRLPFALPHQRIVLMPEGGTREAIQAKQAWLVELCKQHGFYYSPRLHIDIWGEVTGV